MDKDSNFDAAAKNPTSRVRTKLNTKGCCLLCLTVIPNDSNVASTSTGGVSTKPLVPLRSLQCCFGINRRIITNEVPPPVTLDSASAASQTQQDIEVELCEACENVVEKFKKAFLSLEKAQMEVDYWSGKVHHQIFEGSKKPEQVQNYSKRMTSDAETLVQLVFVDNLRKEIAKKSLTNRVGLEAKIYLHQATWTPKEQYLTNDNDKRDQVWSPLETCYFNQDILSETDDGRPSTLSNDDFLDDGEMDLPAVATIKEENPNSSEPPVPSNEPSLSSSEPQTETKLVPSNFAQVIVKNQKTGSYSCTFCNKQLKSKSTANLHYEAIHRGKRYTCQVCETQFTQKGNLNTHRRSCNGKKRKSFSRSTIKKWHFDSQTRKYACAVCKKEFGAKSGAYYHYEAIHLNVKKKHKCEICKIAVYSHSRNLTHHMKTCEATLKRRLAKKFVTKE